MDYLTQYSLVCQVPGAEPYTICAYTGSDLTQVLGITQAPVLHPGYYGWILERGGVYVKVNGQIQAAYADFSPNSANLRLNGQLPNVSPEKAIELPSGSLDDDSINQIRDMRLSQLPPLLIEDGHYCQLIREARDVFVDGHFYACVAMCGISFERFQRDKAEPYGAKSKYRMDKIRDILKKNAVISDSSLILCKQMADMRNEYAHGHGLNPKEDALYSLQWMHSFLDAETNLMRGYVIVNGLLKRTIQ